MSLYNLLSPKNFVELLRRETSRRVIPIDSTWYMPNLNRDAEKEFLEVERIPKSIYFDIDVIKDKSSQYPHMLPDLHTFNRSMSELGVKNDDILVVYDRIGNFSAPRCAWTLAVFGHKPVFLLNNYNLYKAQGYPIDTEKRASLSDYLPTDYKADSDLSSQEVVSYQKMLQLVKSGELAKKFNVFDARALSRFTGDSPEPRPGLPSGHIPGAQPMPFTELLDQENGSFPQTQDDMKAKVQQYLKDSNTSLDPTKPTIAMCGTGVTGLVIKTAMEYAGVQNVKLYDGSWTEWALRADPQYLAKGRD